MLYKPLPTDGKSIRVLEILTEVDGEEYADGIVHCRLEYISLDGTFHGTDADPEKDFHQGNRKYGQGGEITVTSAIDVEKDSEILWKDPLKHPKLEHYDAHSQEEKEASVIDPQRSKDGYLALSYVWGDPTVRSMIMLNGQGVEVTTNLEAALQTLRSSPCVKMGYRIWADALCINLEDVAERSAQIAMMRRIYVKARQVVIFLDSETDDSDLAMTAVKWLICKAAHDLSLQDFYRETKTVDMRPLFIKWSNYVSPFKPEVHTALARLLNRVYWRRLWILQELASGTEQTPVVCGKKSVTWSDIYRTAAIIQSNEHVMGREILTAAEGKSTLQFRWDFTSDRLPRNAQGSASSEKLWKFMLSMNELQLMKHKPSSDLWMSFFRACLMSRDALVTNERDRVYGILGLPGVSSLSTVSPDYTLTPSEVFHKFSQDLLSKGYLSVLRLVNSPIGNVNDPDRTLRKLAPSRWQHLLTSPEAGEIVVSCPHNLPSWVICWTCPRGPVLPLMGSYSASAQRQGEKTQFDSSMKRMQVQAIPIGKAKNLGAFHRDEKDERFPNNGGPISSAYGDSAATRRAFWQTMVAGTSRDGNGSAPDSYEWVLEFQLWNDDIAGARTNGFGLSSFMSRNKKHMLFESTLHDFIYQKDRGKLAKLRRIYSPSEVQRDAASWAMNMLAWKRLVVTDRGHLALSPAATEPEDEIFVVLGCNTPLVLRPHADCYRVVGECYVHGMMNGEVFETSTGKATDVQDITLC